MAKRMHTPFFSVFGFATEETNKLSKNNSLCPYYCIAAPVAAGVLLLRYCLLPLCSSCVSDV